MIKGYVETAATKLLNYKALRCSALEKKSISNGSHNVMSERRNIHLIYIMHGIHCSKIYLLLRHDYDDDLRK